MICKNCGAELIGKYCSSCGEKVYTDKDKSIAHFFEDALHFISHFEGTFLTSLKTVLVAPGRLSLDYCSGKRKPYFKPLTFFLVLVIIYLLLPTFTGLNMYLHQYTGQGLMGKYATGKIQELTAAKHISERELSILFREKSEKTSKFLLLIFIPVCAFFSYLFYRKKRPYFFDHLVLAAETNSFFLIWGFFVLPLTYRLIYYLANWSAELAYADTLLSSLAYLVTAAWLRRAAHRFFLVPWWKASCFALLFCPFHFLVMQWLYRPLLFYFTIIQIH